MTQQIAEQQKNSSEALHKLSMPQRDARLFLILPIFIGVISGLLVVCFRIGIETIKMATLGSAPHRGQFRLLLWPTVAGLIVSLMVRYLFPGTRGSGVNQTKAALYIYDGFISFRTTIGKFLTSAIAIGSGHSLGPEDPALQIGAGVASYISRKMNLSRERLRLFAPVGAAAGLAAAFNAPISAILFVIEEVVGRWNAAMLGSIVLSALSSVVVARWFWGSEPMFRIPSVELRDPRELIAYAIMGIIGGIASLVFSRSLAALRPRLRRMNSWAQAIQPAAAGLLVGVIGFLGFPQVMGPGYEIIDQAMHNQFTWKFLLALGLLKILATTLSFSSGTPGGMFAPTLFIGAMLGASVGTFEKLLFPHLSASVASYALVGMGVLFAGFLRAPLTSVFMVLEVSGNYSIIVPVILANTLAYLLSRFLQPTPIFELFTHEDGLDLPSMEEQREELILSIEDALCPIDVPVLMSSATLSEISAAMKDYGSDAVLLHLSDRSYYAISAEELKKMMAAYPGETGIELILPTDRLPVLFPDQQLDRTLPYFHRWPILVIRNRANRNALNGIVRLKTVLERYQHSEKEVTISDRAE